MHYSLSNTQHSEFIISEFYLWDRELETRNDSLEKKKIQEIKLLH